MPADSKYILGLSGMDSGFAVSLLQDGEVVFAIEEDKLRRFKGLGFKDLETTGSRAIDHAISTVSGGMAGLDAIVYVPPIQADANTSQRHVSYVSGFLVRHYGVAPEVSTVGHVEAHLAFERAAQGSAVDVLMVGRTRAVYSPRGSSAYELDIDFRVVSFVESCSRFIGLERGRIHHLENIARFGEARFIEGLRGLLEAGVESEKLPTALSEVTGACRRRPDDTLEKVHYDLAASLCEVLSHEIVSLLRSVLKQPSQSPVALCGGVFQSWRLNDAIAVAIPEQSFAVSFAPGNPACAIGGPLSFTGSGPAESLSPFLGPNYDRNAVKAILDNCKARYAFHSHQEAIDLSCEALEAGKMVGWFSGRCEFGYRALGARSVFANPANAYATDNLSSYLKKRPSYFAYAAAMNDEDLANKGIRSRYLSRSTHLPEYFGESPVRLQTVSKSEPSGLHDLLDAFQKKTGVPALLNTSLNYFGEPIACTPRDALKTFYASGLDMLVLEDFVLTKS
jgi:predicted NodU family carbamoyl transferase